MSTKPRIEGAARRVIIPLTRQDKQQGQIGDERISRGYYASAFPFRCVPAHPVIASDRREQSNLIVALRLLRCARNDICQGYPESEPATSQTSPEQLPHCHKGEKVL